MNLEDRLRAELERSSRSARVGSAPTVDELTSVATARRKRNRLLGTAGAVALSVTLLFAAFLATQPDDGTVILAKEIDVEGLAEDAGDENSGDSDAQTEVDAGVNQTEPVDEPSAAIFPAPSGDGDGTDGVLEPEPDLGQVAKGGPASEGDVGVLHVTTRESAVDFAGGSGVFVVAHGTGFGGLATKFGGRGSTQVGLASDNGLDWTETQLVGVPDGVTASVLRQFDDGHVALFSRFDVDTQQQQTFVGTSTDLVVWDMSEPLPGDGVATDLAVGSSGVIIIGDDDGPNVWLGPVDGPFEQTARLDANMLYGVTTVGDDFLVVGRSADFGLTVFSSTDGVRWRARPLGSPDVEAANQSVAIADGTIVLTTVNEQGQVSVVSGDGGQTWDHLGNGEFRSISVSGSALGFLGGDGPDATVTLSDGKDLATAALDIAAPDRVALLTTTSNQAVMLVQANNGDLTWVVASR